MSKILAGLILIWVGYTAALIVGGAICLLLKIAMSFLAIWASLVGLMLAIVVGHAILAIVSGFVKGVRL